MNRYRPLLLLLPAAILLVPIVAFPLSPDQGIFFVAAQKILGGAAHYRDIVDVKPPLIYYLYASAILIFGNTEWSIRLLDLLLQIATCWIIISVCRRYSPRPLVAVLTSVTYALLYVGLGSQATAQTESYVAMLGLGAWLLIARNRADGRYLMAGMLCGILFLLKYTLAAMYGILAVCELVLYRERFATMIRHELLLLGGFLATAALLPLYLLVFDAWSGYAELQQFLNGYVLLQMRSPEQAFAMMMRSMAHHLSDNYSISLLVASAVGIALSLAGPRDGTEEGVALERRRFLRFCTIAMAIMAITIVVEGKYFAYQFTRLYPFAVLLAGLGVEKIIGAGVRISRRRMVLLLPLGLLALILSPLPHYLWHSTPFVLQLTSGPEAVDAYYSRDTMLFARTPLKRVGSYVHENLKPGEKMIALASTGGMVYFHARYVPDLPLFHSAFLLAPFAPERWRTMTARFIIDQRPRFIMVEHGDRNESLTSTPLTSPDLFRILPGIDTIVSRKYRSVLRSGSYEVLERNVSGDSANGGTQGG